MAWKCLACQGIHTGIKSREGGRRVNAPPLECPCGMSFKTGWLHVPNARKPLLQKPSARRERIYQRDGNKCLRCGAEKDLTLDHIIPRSKGGTNALDNLQTLCFTCNQAKADTLDEVCA